MSGTGRFAVAAMVLNSFFPSNIGRHLFAFPADQGGGGASAAGSADGTNTEKVEQVILPTVHFRWNNGKVDCRTQATLLLSGLKEGAGVVEGHVMDSLNKTEIMMDATDSKMYDADAYLDMFQMRSPAGNAVQMYTPNHLKRTAMRAAVAAAKGAANSKMKFVHVQDTGSTKVKKELVMTEGGSGARIIGVGSRRNPEYVLHLEMTAESTGHDAPKPSEHMNDWTNPAPGAAAAADGSGDGGS